MPNYISNNPGYEIDRMIDSYLFFRKIIKVYAPEGSVITVINNSTSPATTVPGFAYSNYMLFFPEEYGDYVVSCSYNNVIKSETIHIDTIKVYEVSFDESDTGYLTFSSTAPFSISTYADSTYYVGWDGTMEYSTDTETWITWNGRTALSSNAANRLYIRGSNNTKMYTPGSTPTRFVISSTSGVRCDGNAESLLDYATVLNRAHPTMDSWGLSNLFMYCTTLVSAPKLSATTLSSNCYYRMFMGCTSLTEAPVLPATTLVQNCYSNMFNGCTSLTSAPVLLATTLADGCYSSMFSDCTSITVAPSLPAIIMRTSCYEAMLSGCTSLTTPPALPATTLAQSCYDGMFSGCTSLNVAPALPASALENYCYRYMFQDCTSLKFSATQDSTYRYSFQIPATSATDTTANMMYNTGGSFDGTPVPGNTYYTNNPLIVS